MALNTLIVEALINLVPVVATVLTAVFAWGVKAFVKWLSVKTEIEHLDRVERTVSHMARVVVHTLEETMVKELKAAKDPESDGGTKLTKDEAVAVFMAAKKRLWNLLGQEGRAAVGRMLGDDAPETLESYLDSLLHSQLAMSRY